MKNIGFKAILLSSAFVVSGCGLVSVQKIAFEPGDMNDIGTLLCTFPADQSVYHLYDLFHVSIDNRRFENVIYPDLFQSDTFAITHMYQVWPWGRERVARFPALEDPCTSPAVLEFVASRGQ